MRGAVRRAAIRAALLVVALAALLTALGYLLDIAYAFAAAHVGPLAGGLILAGSMLLAALLLTALATHRRAPDAAQPPRAEGKGAGTSLREAIALVLALVLMITAALARRHHTGPAG